jgi:hypothetical protein
MRFPLVLLWSTLLAVLVPAFAQSATRSKTIFIRSLPLANDPITVKMMDGSTELKSDGRYPPDYNSWETAFEAEEDWITNLSFSIKNVSTKKIRCIIIFSTLTETPFWQNENQPSSVTFLGFAQNRVGRRPEHALHAGDRTFAPDTDAPFELAPGADFTMLIENPKNYSKLKAFIERRMLMSNVDALHSGTITVFFHDGTRWVSINHSYSRPAAEPGKWTKISFEEWAGNQKPSAQ